MKSSLERPPIEASRPLPRRARAGPRFLRPRARSAHRLRSIKRRSGSPFPSFDWGDITRIPNLLRQRCLIAKGAEPGLCGGCGPRGRPNAARRSPPDCQGASESGRMRRYFQSACFESRSHASVKPVSRSVRATGDRGPESRHLPACGGSYGAARRHPPRSSHVVGRARTWSRSGRRSAVEA